MDWQEKWERRPPTADEAARERERIRGESARARLASLHAKYDALPEATREAHTYVDGDCRCGWQGSSWGGRLNWLYHALEAAGVKAE